MSRHRRGQAPGPPRGLSSGPQHVHQVIVQVGCVAGVGEQRRAGRHAARRRSRGWAGGHYVVEFDALDGRPDAGPARSRRRSAGVGDRHGTGHVAALLCERLGEGLVHSVELDPVVARQAAGALAQAGYRPHLRVADGEQPWPGLGPVDRLIATCALRYVPYALLRQVRPRWCRRGPARPGVLVRSAGPAPRSGRWHRDLPVLRRGHVQGRAHGRGTSLPGRDDGLHALTPRAGSPPARGAARGCRGGSGSPPRSTGPGTGAWRVPLGRAPGAGGTDAPLRAAS